MNDDEKTCPHCAEIIKRAAKVCRFCGRDMPGTGDPIQQVKARSGILDGVKIGVGMFVVLPILIVVVVLAFLVFSGFWEGTKRAIKIVTSEKSAHSTELAEATARAGVVKVTPKDVPRARMSKSEIEWVAFQGGSFSMGSVDGGPSAEENEMPRHRVTVPNFSIAKTLVTNKQYKTCVDAGACTPAHISDSRCNVYLGGNNYTPNLPESFQGDDMPVMCVNWEQAKAFSQWVGGRLPTEAEWEYAARGGGKEQKYPWGNKPWTCARENEEALCPNSDRPMPVCSKPAGNTQQGLCDMSGRVRQWMQDWYHRDYQDAPDDGSAWEDTVPIPGTPGYHRVLRGDAGPILGRVAYRAYYGAPPEYFSSSIGFRPAR